MLIAFITGLSPAKETFPVIVAALASSTGAAGAVVAAAGASLFDSDVSDFPQPEKSSSDAAPQLIKNFFIL
jgi:hypothetical protein